ncbi:MAG TPA: 3-oxoacyl-[acyl-carrier-protein] reductase [Candidatus Omnitrophota bacterium]|nr:3-oxoacyl-[acyl-carrier-protein] reductase [Candidatus Omnitrophota bacterium]MDD5270255.1 3-oxoacyl-[acyl-carrier-protein] reductase [Candidatus Omnitrophota bacterium]HOX10166.1 3-oxoacyl-[acyl-carrier-protein] reductase [Candidatus Omnitrophota bacterium]HPN66109.1 3-oxoacyl-[acyl-carrier-protein] reductase [Candidatus Omnitrophota bacterium]
MIFKDRVCLVTGGARGIGREIALAFAKNGADIALCDVNQEALNATSREIEALGRKAATFVVDVTNLSQVEDMVNKTLDKFQKIDILINNAGITRDALIVRMSEQEFDSVIAVNLKGTFNCTKACSKVMMKQRYGKIVSIASIIGIMGNAGQANYAASKAGIIGITKSVAKELASRNVNVNAIAPGFIETDMTAKLPENVKAQMLSLIPLNRFGKANDVAELAMFLASEASSYITGQVIKIDGGMVM